jgi:antitoxin (DNA-binding transcriptional repressor) of toxin-antitoxin stability system
VTINVNNYEAERRLSWLLKQVANGERVVIWQEVHPIADLAPHQHQPVIIGALKDELAYDDATFDDPDPDIQRMFHPDEAASQVINR